jgi:hypothetical protein
MTVKKSYNVGDAVWVYGINRNNTKPTQGKVIKIVDLSDTGHTDSPHYIISIPTHIEPLLEIRTWHNISQDERGPIGSFREIGNIESTIKFVSQVGFAFDDSPNLDTGLDDEITLKCAPEELEQNREAIKLQPPNLTQEKPKRKYFRKKSRNG